MDRDLLFYQEYEAFYHMADASAVFAAFCRDAYGEDFSQDGFSDLWQIKQILPYVPKGGQVLDIGCGNGKLLGYLQRHTDAFIHGFDYSTNAIETARRLFPNHSDFRVGIIGQQEYPEDRFDLVISMDSLYFAPDMTQLIRQIKRWLKPGGVFFAGYQEGDVIPKTPCWETSLLAQALRAGEMACSVTDITHETWQMLRRKREAAIAHREAFLREGLAEWHAMLMGQTDCAAGGCEAFAKACARYLVVASKPNDSP